MSLSVNNPFTTKLSSTYETKSVGAQKSLKEAGYDHVQFQAAPKKKNSLAGDLISGAIVGSTLGTYGPGPFIFPHLYNPFFYNPFMFGGGFGYYNPWLYGGYRPFAWI